MFNWWAVDSSEKNKFDKRYYLYTYIVTITNTKIIIHINTIHSQSNDADANMNWLPTCPLILKSWEKQAKVKEHKTINKCYVNSLAFCFCTVNEIWNMKQTPAETLWFKSFTTVRSGLGQNAYVAWHMLLTGSLAQWGDFTTMEWFRIRLICSS